MRLTFILAAAALCAALSAGCSEGNRSSGPTVVEQGAVSGVTDRSIAWFPGTIEEAFASAKARSKPLFLYWGADWCPYCKLLEATIFMREEFIELSRQFVALDMSSGGAESIRKADEYRIYGLPTVIVFAPDGTELTRLRGGMDMEQYAAVLELTLNALRPVSEVLAAVEAGENISDRDWQLLAAYSWRQDRGQVLGEREPSEVLKQLWTDCPPGLTHSRASLALSAIGAWMARDEAGRDPEDGRLYLGEVNRILGEPDLRAANLTRLADLGGDMVTTLVSGEAQRTLQQALLSLYRDAAGEETLNVLHRAAVLSGWAEVATALLDEDETLPTEQVNWAQAQVAATIDELSPYQTHAGINSLWGVYYDLGMEQEARDALAIGMEVSSSPFYFMSAMGYIEREAGNSEAALDWYRKAWETTQKPLDRVSWGRGYLLRLIQLAPDDIAGIRTAGSEVLADISSQEGGLAAYQRTLDRIGEALLAWSADSEERSEVLAALKAQLSASCARLSEGDPAATGCRSFLQREEVATAV